LGNGGGDGVDEGTDWPVLTRILCVNPCVKKFPKLAKTWKINKNVEIVYPMLSEC
jgi:hypothetical protein